MKRASTAIALLLTLPIVLLKPQPVKANAALLIPETAAIVVILGLTYYTWVNSEGYKIWTNSQGYEVPDPSPALEVRGGDSGLWDDPIIAASPEEARQECQARAKRDGVTLDRVQEPRQVRRGTNQSYRCWFK
jgi:hypothetical protein